MKGVLFTKCWRSPSFSLFEGKKLNAYGFIAKDNSGLFFNVPSNEWSMDILDNTGIGDSFTVIFPTLLDCQCRDEYSAGIYVSFNPSNTNLYMYISYSILVLGRVSPCGASVLMDFHNIASRGAVL